MNYCDVSATAAAARTRYGCYGSERPAPPGAGVRGPKWGGLDLRGYVLFALPTVTSHRDAWCDLVYAASAAGSPLTIIAQAILAILLASAMAATLVGRRTSNAVSQGRRLVPWILA